MIKAHEKMLAGGRIRMCFFTRHGGVSEGQYQSLNCGLGSDDEKENVIENRARVAQYMGVASENLFSVYQHHSNIVHIVDDGWDRNSPPRADAMLTSKPGVGLGILTADCGPILFADADANVIAAAHSGWRGALSGINENVLDAMEAKGAHRDSISVVIGPMIAQASYEVGAEIRDEVTANHADDAKLFTLSENPGKFMFDLPGLIAQRLTRAGVAHIENLNLDTYALEDDYFSYRRNTHRNIADYGRGISVITISA